MSVLQKTIADYPIYCNRCRDKTKGIVGSGNVFKNRDGSYQFSGACINCRGRKASKVGGSVVDSFLKEWSSKAPESIKELHLWTQPGKSNLSRPKKSSFLGPGTQLSRRLNGWDRENGTFTSINTPPINKLDEGALYHDLCYSKYPDTKNRQDCDRDLIDIADEVARDKSQTHLNRLTARAVSQLFRKKIKMNL